MEKFKIIKEHQSYGTRIQIELHEDKVCFSYTGVDTEMGHIDNAFGCWPVEKYNAAIDKLERTGYCCLGEKGNEMQISSGYRSFAIDGIKEGCNMMDINFDGNRSGYNNKAYICGLTWKVEELKIK
jgi:hypothetical protein